MALVNKLRNVIPLSFLVLLMGLTPSERGESNEYDNDSVFVDYHILHRCNSWIFFNEIIIFNTSLHQKAGESLLEITVQCPHCNGLNEVSAEAGEPGDCEYADFKCNECEEDFYIVVNFAVRK